MQKIQGWFLSYFRWDATGPEVDVEESLKGSASCGSNFKADIAILIDATDGRPELFQKQKDFARRILSEKWFPNIGAETRLKVVPYSLTLSKHVTPFNKSLDQIGHHRYLDKVWPSLIFRDLDLAVYFRSSTKSERGLVWCFEIL